MLPVRANDGVEFQPILTGNVARDVSGYCLMS
jgi:hypothetical protein